MLPESYFNGQRLEAYLEILGKSVQKKESLFDKIFATDIARLEDALMTGREYVYDNGSFYKVSTIELEAYKEYKKTDNRMRFEEKILGIRFSFKEEHYYKLIKYRDNLIYFYSTIDRREEKDGVVIQLRGNQFYYDRKEVDRIALMDSDIEYLRVLDQIGTQKLTVKEPVLESVDNGQLKIGTDLVKLAQMLDTTSGVHFLGVGTSSEGYGGGKSYMLLDTMFTNSTFTLYDPFEVDLEYKTDRGNVYKRIKAPFDYSKSDLTQYNLVQDDAYISFNNNRMKIDPDKKLLTHPRFSCKYLATDRHYFSNFVQVKQVGKTSSRERRAMSRMLLVVDERDYRFGSCQFCLDLAKYVKRGKYGIEFFDAWKKMHPTTTNCGYNVDVDLKLVGGQAPTMLGDMYFEYEVPKTYSLDYDMIPNTEVVNVVDVKLGWYQFSCLEKVPKEIRLGKFCIFSREANGYFCSQSLGTIAPQVQTSGAVKFNNIFFLPISKPYVEANEFKSASTSVVRVTDSTMREKFNFYRSVWYDFYGTAYESVPKVKMR